MQSTNSQSDVLMVNNCVDKNSYFINVMFAWSCSYFKPQQTSLKLRISHCYRGIEAAGGGKFSSNVDHKVQEASSHIIQHQLRQAL